MIPNADEIGEAVAKERALGWTLGMALFGVACLAPAAEPLSGWALVALFAFGALGWTASHRSVDAADRLIWLATGGILLAIPGAATLASGLPSFAILDAALAALLVSFGWSLDGRLASLGEHLDDADVARAYGAKWLLAIALSSMAVGLAVGAPPLGVAGGLVAVLACARWALARDALTTRRRWLDDVRRGREPRWTIEPRAPHEPLSSSLAPLSALYPLDGVLVGAPGAGPYRGRPLALVPLGAGGATAPRWTDVTALRRGLAVVLAMAGPWIASALGWAWLDAQRGSCIKPSLPVVVGVGIAGAALAAYGARKLAGRPSLARLAACGISLFLAQGVSAIGHLSWGFG